MLTDDLPFAVTLDMNALAALVPGLDGVQENRFVALLGSSAIVGDQCLAEALTVPVRRLRSNRGLGEKPLVLDELRTRDDWGAVLSGVADSWALALTEDRPAASLRALLNRSSNAPVREIASDLVHSLTGDQVMALRRRWKRLHSGAGR